MTKKSIDFDYIIIETPEGKKFTIHPILAYAPDYRKWGIIAHRKQWEQWYGQFVDICPNLGECGTFIDAGFNPTNFLYLLKKKGYKVYWRDK